MQTYDILTWAAIVVCLSQSAMFSGLNLALFSLGRLRLEAETEKGNTEAEKILKLRRDSNLLLCTILWGNVSINVLLTLLTDSVLAGWMGFFLSTFFITFFGEIIPQAYFSRNALRVGAKLIPIVKFYRVLLFPLAKPCAMILDGWIGPEGPSFFRERDIEIILEKHIKEEESEISANEGQGALNFLALDDRKIALEGSPILESTILQYPTKLDVPDFPALDTEDGMAFIHSLETKPSMHRVIVDDTDTPLVVLDTTEFLARYAIHGNDVDIYRFCYRPIVTSDQNATLDTVLGSFVVEADDLLDNVVDQDVVLYWTAEDKRILTGADIFGHLLRGIAKREPMAPADRAEA